LPEKRKQRANCSSSFTRQHGAVRYDYDHADCEL